MKGDSSSSNQSSGLSNESGWLRSMLVMLWHDSTRTAARVSACDTMKDKKGSHSRMQKLELREKTAHSYYYHTCSLTRMGETGREADIALGPGCGLAVKGKDQQVGVLPGHRRGRLARTVGALTGKRQEILVGAHGEARSVMLGLRAAMGLHMLMDEGMAPLAVATWGVAVPALMADRGGTRQCLLSSDRMRSLLARQMSEKQLNKGRQCISKQGRREKYVVAHMP